MDVSIFKHEVLTLKYIGSMVWQSAVIFCTFVAWRWAEGVNITSPASILFGWLNLSIWISSVGLIFAQAPACLGYALWMTTSEPSSTRCIKLLWLPTFVAVELDKWAARCSTLPSVLALLTGLVLHLLSALLTLSALDIGSSGFAVKLLYSCCLTLVYSLLTTHHSWDVPLFPLIQRHRYFRLKQRVLPAIATAATITLLTAIAAVAASLLWGWGLPPLLRPAAAVAACAFYWRMAAAVLEVVFTERLRPGDYSCNDPLTSQAAALAGKQGPLMADLALHDLAGMAADGGRAAWRRAEVFRDDSGARWRSIATPCIAVLVQTTAVVSAPLPGRPAASGAAASSSAAAAAAVNTGGTGRKWNALPTTGSRGASVTGRQQLAALLTVRSQYQRAALAAAALSDFCVASTTEDRLGILQLVDPGLGNVVTTLLNALLAVQQLQRQLGSASRAALGARWRGVGDGGSGSAHADAALLALQDVLTTAVYSITGAFGEGLEKVVAECGATGDVVKLLRKCLAGQM